MTQETALVLRVCKSDMTSHGGFVWPSEVGAEVVAPDWIANDECGNGLHGWLYGQGKHDCVDHWRDAEAKWLVLEAVLADVVMLGGKCKFPRAVVRFVGGKSDAAAHIIANEPRSAGVVVIGETKVVGDKQAATVGALGTATAGYSGELRIKWYDNKANRYRTAQAYVGENGIKANTPYRLNDKHEFVEVTK